jgi:hypothetical protein
VSKIQVSKTCQKKCRNQHPILVVLTLPKKGVDFDTYISTIFQHYGVGKTSIEIVFFNSVMQKEMSEKKPQADAFHSLEIPIIY